jgi:hypothetical protein
VNLSRSAGGTGTEDEVGETAESGKSAILIVPGFDIRLYSIKGEWRTELTA